MKPATHSFHQKGTLAAEFTAPGSKEAILGKLGRLDKKSDKKSLKSTSKNETAGFNYSAQQSVNLHDFLSSRGSTISQLVNDRTNSSKPGVKKHNLHKSISSSKKLNHSQTPTESMLQHVKSGSKSSSPDGSSQAGSSQEKKLPPKGPRAPKTQVSGNMFQSYHQSQDLEDNYDMKRSLVAGQDNFPRAGVKARKSNGSRKQTDLGAKSLSNPNKAESKQINPIGYYGVQDRVQFGSMRESLGSRQIRKPKIKLHDFKSREALSFDYRPNMQTLEEARAACEPNASRLSSVKSSALNSVCYLPPGASPLNINKEGLDERFASSKGQSSQRKQMSKYFGEVFGQMFNFRKKQKNHMSFVGYSANDSDVSRAAVSKKRVPNMLTILANNQIAGPKSGLVPQDISQLKNRKSRTVVVASGKLSQLSTRKGSPGKFQMHDFQDPYCLSTSTPGNPHRLPASHRAASTRWTATQTPASQHSRSKGRGKLDIGSSRASSSGTKAVAGQDNMVSIAPGIVRPRISNRNRSPHNVLGILEIDKDYHHVPRDKKNLTSRVPSIKDVKADKRPRSSSFQSENKKLMFRPKSVMIASMYPNQEGMTQSNVAYSSGRHLDRPNASRVDGEDLKALKSKKKNPFLECIKDITLAPRRRNFKSLDGNTAKSRTTQLKTQGASMFATMREPSENKGKTGNNSQVLGSSQVRQGSLPSKMPSQKQSFVDTSTQGLGRKKASHPKASVVPRSMFISSIVPAKVARKKGSSRRTSPVSENRDTGSAQNQNKQRKPKQARIVIAEQAAPLPKRTEHTEFSYKKNVNGVFISSSFLLDNELLEADLSKSLGNVWGAGEFGMARQAGHTEESSSPDKGAEFKIHEIMGRIDPKDPNSISLHWLDVLYVLKQDYLRLSYLNSFENILRLIHTIVVNWDFFKEHNFEAIFVKGKKLFPSSVSGTTPDKLNSKFRHNKYQQSANDNLIDLEADLNFGANQLHNRLELGTENMPGLSDIDERDLTVDVDIQPGTITSTEAQITTSKFFENQRSTSSQDPQASRGNQSLQGTGKLGNVQDSTQGRLSSVSQELGTNLKATQSLQESTKIKTSKMRDKYQTIFFMISLKTYFMTVDEQIVLENPIFTEIVRMFHTVVTTVCATESLAVAPAIQGFERLLAKLRDNSYRIKNEDFSQIVDTFVALLDTRLQIRPLGQDSLQRTGFGNVLSEPKLDIIECVDKNIQINVGVSLKAVQDLARIGPCMFSILESRITAEHAKISAQKLAPIVHSMLTFDQTENIDYLVQACHLYSVIVQTLKVYDHIKLPVELGTHLFSSLLQVLIGSSRLALIRKHRSMYPMLVNLKKYFQVTIHNLWGKLAEAQQQQPRQARIKGLFETPMHSKLPLMDFKVFHSLQEVVTDIFLNIFIDPIDIKQENHYVEVFYVMFDVMIEFSCFCRETAAPFFPQMIEPLRKMALDFMTALDSVDKSGPQGKIAEEVLLLIWRVGEITNQSPAPSVY